MKLISHYDCLLHRNLVYIKKNYKDQRDSDQLHRSMMLAWVFQIYFQYSQLNDGITVFFPNISNCCI